MLILYEHYKNAKGTVISTDILCVSHFGRPTIDWTIQADKIVFALFKEQFLKSVSLNNRMYDENTHIWTFLSNYGEFIINEIEKSPLKGSMLKPVAIEGLQAKVASGSIPDPALEERQRRANIKPEEFFYNRALTGVPALTREQIIEKLATQLGLQPADFSSLEPKALKRVYLKTVFRLHPDRGTDGKALSELNSLWQVYNA